MSSDVRRIEICDEIIGDASPNLVYKSVAETNQRKR